MSTPSSPVDPDLTDLSRRLDDELQTIRRKGWHGFRVSDCPLLAQTFPPGDGEAPEAPIRRRLLELIDPAPVDARGRTLERPPLEKRDPRDRGLLGRIMFGEPGVLTFEREGRPDLIIKPRELLVTRRYEALAELRRHGNTINASPGPGRPRGGVGTELMLDLRDALLPEVTAACAPPSNDSTRPRARPPRFGGQRIVVGALGFLALVAVAAVVVLIATGNDDRAGGQQPSPRLSGTATSEPKAMATSRAYNLAAGLRAANLSIDRRWGTSIRADPTDNIAFALTIRNDAPVNSYPLAAWTEHDTSDHASDGRRVRMVIAHSNGQVLMKTPWVLVRAWTSRFGIFHIRSTDHNVIGRVKTSDGRVARTIRRHSGPQPNMIPSILSPQVENGLDDLSIGSLKSGEQVLVTFNASWEPTKEVWLGSFPPIFVHEGRPTSKAVEMGSARIGDRLRFFILLDNQGTVRANVSIRVVFRPRMHGRVVQMTAFGKLHDQTTEIGTATINSSDGKPIRITPVPGTTLAQDRQLGAWTKAAKCDLERFKVVKRPLADGIALAGVDVGSFGGFTPHSECPGTEFNKWIEFRATVTRG